MNTQRPKFDVLIYCEQPSHWQNVSEIYQALKKIDNGKIKIALLTSYTRKEYPEVDYPAGLFGLEGVSLSFVKNIDCKIMLTPFVGLPLGILPRSTVVIHSLVSLAGLDGVYEDSMFTGYDYILAAGPHHIHDFRRWSEQFPPLRGKTLIPAGYPKLDLLLKELGRRPQLLRLAEKKTVVYAPTHVYAVNEKLASLRRNGRRIVSHLLGLGYRVIFRPHPVSFYDKDRFLVDEIARAHSGNPDFELDASKEYFSTYSKADMMVTDLSGTGFTFSFTFTRPTIFFAADYESEAFLTGIQFKEREEIGFVVRSIGELHTALTKLDSLDWSRKIGGYRAGKIFNLGSSGEYAAESIFKILCGQKAGNWVSI